MPWPVPLRARPIAVLGGAHHCAAARQADPISRTVAAAQSAQGLRCRGLPLPARLAAVTHARTTGQQRAEPPLFARLLEPPSPLRRAAVAVPVAFFRETYLMP